MNVGDSLEVFSPGKHWLCRIDAVLSQGVRLQVTKEFPVPTPPKLRLIFGQALIKMDKFELVIQKATELGVAEIFPLATERSVVRPANIDTKVQRWNEIAEHAAGQSENSYPTQIHPPETLSQFLRRELSPLKLVLHEREGSLPLPAILSGVSIASITFIVGPEGGWSSAEGNAITAAGFVKVNLGSRILRSETAGLVLTAILQYQLGDLAG